LSTLINMEFTMALKGQISLAFLSVSFLALELSLWFFPSISAPTGVVGSRAATFKSVPTPAVSPEISVEIKPVLSAVSIHDVGDIPIVQQPPGDSNFVSKNDGEVTQFASATRYGNIGLLAHNYLSGKSFSKIQIGQQIHLIYSDGTVENYVVTKILRYQALDPKSPYSSFQNLDDQDEILTVGQMFDRAYQGGRHVTFQTCIASQGNSSWGRLFIIASPAPDTFGFNSSSRTEFP
jgi:hypothetical protein